MLVTILFHYPLSGFGWDPEKKCVTAEDHVWDEYIKVMTYYMLLFIMTFDNTLIIISSY